jgi:hypothetical protein
MAIGSNPLKQICADWVPFQDWRRLNGDRTDRHGRLVMRLMSASIAATAAITAVRAAIRPRMAAEKAIEVARRIAQRGSRGTVTSDAGH